MCVVGISGTLPCNHHVFPIRLCVKALHDIQTDLGSAHPILLHLVREEAHLSGEPANRLWRAGAGDVRVTEKVHVINYDSCGTLPLFLHL